MPGLDYIKGYEEGKSVEPVAETPITAVGKAVQSKSKYALPTPTGAAGVDQSILERMQKLIDEREARKGGFMESLKDAQAWWTGGVAGPSEALARRTKEREEQAYVSDFIKSAIEEYGELMNETAVNERIAGPVKHLCTEFTFTLSDENLKPFIQTIHPTPAVCGIPVKEAAQLYKSLEVHDRRLYTGMIGLLSKDNLNIFVNLRCMQCSDKYVYLFVGGGITKDSDPESEWKETVRKSTTLSHYL